MDIPNKFIFTQVYTSERNKGGFINRPAAVVEAVRFWNDMERQFKTAEIRNQITDYALKIARSTNQPLTTKELTKMVDTPIGEGDPPTTPKPADEEEILTLSERFDPDYDFDSDLGPTRSSRPSDLPSLEIPAAFMSPPFDDDYVGSDFRPPTDEDRINSNIEALFSNPPGKPVVYSNHAINLAQRVISGTYRDVVTICEELPKAATPEDLVTWAEEVLST